MYSRELAPITALLHHVSIDALRDAFLALKRRAASGEDGVMRISAIVDAVSG